MLVYGTFALYWTVLICRADYLLNSKMYIIRKRQEPNLTFEQIVLSVSVLISCFLVQDFLEAIALVDKTTNLNLFGAQKRVLFDGCIKRFLCLFIFPYTLYESCH